MHLTLQYLMCVCVCIHIHKCIYIYIGPGHSARFVGPFGGGLDRLGRTLSSLCVGFVVTEVSYSPVTEVS